VDFGSALFGSLSAIVPIVVKYYLDEKSKAKQKRLEKIEETYTLLFQIFNWANVLTINTGNLPLKSIKGVEDMDLPIPDFQLARITMNIRVHFPDLSNELENLRASVSDFSSSHTMALLRLQEMVQNNSVDFAEFTKELREKSILVHTAQTCLQCRLEAMA